MPCLAIWAEPRLRFGRCGRPNLEGRRYASWAGLCLGFDRGLSDAQLGSDGYGPNQGVVRLEVGLPGRTVRLCVYASAEPLGRFGATLSCRYPRMELGRSEAGADLRPIPSYLGEDLLHYGFPSLTRRVSRTVLRVPMRRKLLGGRALFEGIPEGTKRQDDGSCRAPPGAGGVLSWLCPNPMYLGTMVYKVTQAPSRGDGRFSPHFPPFS